MQTVDDAQSPNSGEHDANSSAMRRNIKLEDDVNPQGKRSIGDSRIMVSFKSSSPLFTPEKVGFEKVSAGEEEKIPARKPKLNNISSEDLQSVIGNPNCNKESARVQRIWERADRLKFFPLLCYHEIEQDFIYITGKKPPGNPMKRPRVLQNQVNAIFPCHCLAEVHADHYKDD
ncbi:unnamed protein product [Lactuca saligna]|uniref:Uncharacterized protein n=1 Tax=Lactuca saligna TaxID=75948 RepID=A0AA35YLD6_LACSI|nr:unnamed protein product [Lactuca saligna]